MANVLVVVDPVEMVSLVATNSQILKKDVYLINKISRADPDSKEKKVLAHMKALYFIRPTKTNLDYLLTELSSPQYSEYYLCTPHYSSSCDHFFHEPD